MSDGKYGLTLARSPQVFDRTSTSSIMWTVTLCLTPAAIFGIVQYGLDAFAVLLVSIASAILTELLLSRLVSRPDGRATRSTISDGSATLSGLLIGMTMPPAVPLYVPIAASVFAMGIVKWSFGGLGSNWMNPALAARAFVQFSWPHLMSSWVLPRSLSNSIDAVSSATPLGTVRQAISAGTPAASGPMDLLRAGNFPRSPLDLSVTQWLNMHVLSHLGISLPAGYVDLFVGNLPGAIGESSALLLLVGSVFLFGRRIISYEIPLSFFLSFGVLEWIFGGMPYGTGPFSGDVLFQILTGGFILVIFFMATDNVTSPMTGVGMLVFGTGAGTMTFIIRQFGSMPEGVGMAVIFMNMFVPLINRITIPRRYGSAVPAGGERLQ